ncbi:Alpha/Beta hydrolase protein [Nemania sp. FL0916]|nr:Alpha/Beta hydrolase protein [Nemania sp. FL0916]
MLPRPCLSFTLPSTHDGTKLDCRVYHPPCLLSPSRSPPTSSSGTGTGTIEHAGRETGISWAGHAAVIAHPYAPLGGSFDDPIVDVAGATLLQLGFVVATFNFRGAGRSEGKTSWTARPEVGDYSAVVGFLGYYVHFLLRSSSSSSPPSSAVPFGTLREGQQQQQQQRNGIGGGSKGSKGPVMLLAGYSYGAMITTRLPALEEILASFATPATESPEADIRLRAQHLATVQSALLLKSPPGSPRKSMGVRVGGADSASGGRVRSGSSISARTATAEFLREDRIRENVRLLLARAKTKTVYRRSSRGIEPAESANRKVDERMDHCLEKIDDIPAFRSAYLVISPPVGLVTRLATMSFANPLSFASPLSSRSTGAQHDAEYATLAQNPALIIYGDQDGFISYRKMREWTQQLERGSAARVVEVPGAGHFWMEGDAVYQLRDAIGNFAMELIQLGDSGRIGDAGETAGL